MKPHPRLCIDCIHSRQRLVFGEWHCTRDAASSINIVTGEARPRFCEIERESFFVGCGPEAIHFEPKPKGGA